MRLRPWAFAAREYALSTSLESWSTAHFGERGLLKLEKLEFGDNLSAQGRAI